MIPATSNIVASFPMGPHVRAWLGITENQYQGDKNTSPSAEQFTAFSERILEHLEEETPNNAEHLVDLLEELVGMNLPLLAVKLSDAYPALFPHNDFRANLHLGNASMLIGDLAKAELAFIAAQKLVPEEPAPYINLVQIYCHDGALDRARKWCMAGLQSESDNTRLWELLGWIEQTTSSGNNESAAIEIARLAKKLNSWAGTSLACDMQNADDPLVKLAALEQFWDEGLRYGEFLIEFTAILGMAGRYDRIPSIIWQAEKSSSQPLPWQLTLHLAQSHLGLGRDDDALETLNKLSKIEGLPDIAHQAVQAIREEVQNSKIKH